MKSWKNSCCPSGSRVEPHVPGRAMKVLRCDHVIVSTAREGLRAHIAFKVALPVCVTTSLSLSAMAHFVQSSCPCQRQFY